jgi:hypothetical protein
MRKLTHVLPAMLIAALALTAAGFADDGPGKGKDRAKNAQVTTKFSNTDSGSCQQNHWALLQITRTLKVHDMGGGVLSIQMKDRGTFTTLAGQSPGACEQGSKHGQLIVAGLTGRYHGTFRGTVTNATFNKDAQCGPTCTQSQYMAAFFGPTMKFSCWEGQAPCHFDFHYDADKTSKKTLLYHHWQDRGTATTEVMKGDIATS